MGNIMKNKYMLFVSPLIFVGVLLLMGVTPQAQAVLPLSKMEGVIAKKIRYPEPVQPRYAEPGSMVTRSDKAKAIIFDGNLMFIVQETVVKRIDGTMIDFDEVAVPCQVNIAYQQLPNGNRNVMEVYIQRELPGANKRWPAPEPQ